MRQMLDDFPGVRAKGEQAKERVSPPGRNSGPRGYERFLFAHMSREISDGVKSSCSARLGGRHAGDHRRRLVECGICAVPNSFPGPTVAGWPRWAGRAPTSRVWVLDLRAASCISCWVDRGKRVKEGQSLTRFPRRCPARGWRCPKDRLYGLRPRGPIASGGVGRFESRHNDLQEPRWGQKLRDSFAGRLGGLLGSRAASGTRSEVRRRTVGGVG